MSDPITELDIDQIQRRIPHRPPMLLIDRVEDIVPDTSAVGVKMVSVNEPFFAGHFPDYPIMPGVLIVEAMAQTAACMVSVTLGGDTDDKLVFSPPSTRSVSASRFDPARFWLHIEKRGAKGPLWKFSGHATVDGVKTSEAEFAAMIVDPQR